MARRRRELLAQIEVIMSLNVKNCIESQKAAGEESFVFLLLGSWPGAGESLGSQEKRGVVMEKSGLESATRL